MRKIVLAALLFTVCTATKAQSPYVSSKDPSNPAQHIFNGIITKYALINDSSFAWYASSQKIYTPLEDAVSALSASVGKVNIVLFGGTWCEDTQFILPKFFALQEKSGFPDAGISFFAVDRSKKTIGGVADAFKITNVPTIIVMKDGKEIGRVVEYGKTGKWDKELADMLR
jgi:thiol-disulfide isomerase/thioredoxin